MGISNTIPPSRLIQPGVVANTAARPTSPFTGQAIYQVDTNQMLIWNGSAWVIPNSLAQNPTGLELIKAQTVGTGVSSVTVSSAFSSDYDNYRIVYTGGVSSVDNDLKLTLGASATGYYSGFVYVPYATGTLTGAVNNNATSWSMIGAQATTGNSVDVELFGPNQAIRTGMSSRYFGIRTTSVGGSQSGFHNATTQHTAFTITCSSGNITGGIVYVYGFRKA